MSKLRNRSLAMLFGVVAVGGFGCAMLQGKQAGKANASKGAPQFAQEIHGAAAVAEIFKGRAQAARLAILDGAVGAVFAPGGTPRVAFEFTIEGERIVGIRVIADPQSVRGLQIAIVDD